VARPTKYTPERAQQIVDALTAGNTRRAAAAAAGVSEDSLERWLGRFAGFAGAIQKAEAEAELDHVGTIQAAAANGSWQASAWWLERRRSDDWGRKERVEIISSVREMARRAGLSVEDEARALEEAERMLREVRGGERRPR
jgi:transposase